MSSNELRDYVPLYKCRCCGKVYHDKFVGRVSSKYIRDIMLDFIRGEDIANNSGIPLSMLEIHECGAVDDSYNNYTGISDFIGFKEV